MHTDFELLESDGKILDGEEKKRNFGTESQENTMGHVRGTMKKAGRVVRGRTKGANGPRGAAGIWEARRYFTKANAA